MGQACPEQQSIGEAGAIQPRLFLREITQSRGEDSLAARAKPGSLSSWPQGTLGSSAVRGHNPIALSGVLRLRIHEAHAAKIDHSSARFRGYPSVSRSHSGADQPGWEPEYP